MKLILFIALVFANLINYAQEFKPSLVSQADRKQILKDLKEMSDKDQFYPLLKIIDKDSVKFIRVYYARLKKDYSFNKNAINYLEPETEQIWFSVPVKSGDSIIAVSEKYEGRYQGLIPTFQDEDENYKSINEWLQSSGESLKKKTLFFISGNINWNVIDSCRVFVLEAGKLEDFNTYFKEKYGNVENFRRSF